MSDAQSAQSATTDDRRAPLGPGGGFTQAACIVAAALLATAGTAWIAKRLTLAAPPTLSLIAASEINDALPSLEPSMAAKAGEEARQCKMPLAYLTLRAAPGNTVIGVRIRSGTYTSPSLTLSDQPRRIAVPLPSAYPVGSGQIFIEGAVRDVTAWLTPAVTIGPQSTSNHINVVWATDNPCPR